MPELNIGPVMNEVYIDGTVRYGAKASWRSGDNVSTGVSVHGFSTYEEAKTEVRKRAIKMGWAPDNA